MPTTTYLPSYVERCFYFPRFNIFVFGFLLRACSIFLSIVLYCQLPTDLNRFILFIYLLCIFSNTMKLICVFSRFFVSCKQFYWTNSCGLAHLNVQPSSRIRFSMHSINLFFFPVWVWAVWHNYPSIDRLYGAHVRHATNLIQRWKQWEWNYSQKLWIRLIEIKLQSITDVIACNIQSNSFKLYSRILRVVRQALASIVHQISALVDGFQQHIAGASARPNNS